MKIGVIGAGNVGTTLGRRWADAGHQVRYGVRDVAKYPDLATDTVASVSEWAEAVVLATPWTATRDAIESAGELAGKVVIDATNPIAPDFSGLLPGPSAGEQVASWASGAKVVKAFNTIGYNLMADPTFPAGAATLLLAGDDAVAKTLVAGLAGDIGFDPVDAGPLSQSRYMEAQAWLWISLAMKFGHGRDIAFKLIRR